MANTTDIVVDYLTTIPTGHVDTRSVRAALTAQILSSLIPLELGVDLEDIRTKTEREVKSILSSVNERVQIDTTLTLELFYKALKVRHDIIYAPTNLDAIRTTLSGDAVSSNLTPEVSDILSGIGANSTYLMKTKNTYEELLDTGLFTQLIAPATGE